MCVCVCVLVFFACFISVVHEFYGSLKSNSPAWDRGSSVPVSAGVTAPTKYSAVETGDRQLWEHVWRQFSLMDNSQDIIIQAECWWHETHLKYGLVPNWLQVAALSNNFPTRKSFWMTRTAIIPGFCNTSSGLFFPLTFKILIHKDTFDLSTLLCMHFTARLSLPGLRTSSDYFLPRR